MKGLIDLAIPLLFKRIRFQRLQLQNSTVLKSPAQEVLVLAFPVSEVPFLASPVLAVLWEAEWVSASEVRWALASEVRWALASEAL